MRPGGSAALRPGVGAPDGPGWTKRASSAASPPRVYAFYQAADHASIADGATLFATVQSRIGEGDPSAESDESMPVALSDLVLAYVLLFLVGYAVNLSADRTLRSLRAAGNGYQIPRGGLYRCGGACARALGADVPAGRGRPVHAGDSTGVRGRRLRPCREPGHRNPSARARGRDRQACGTLAQAHADGHNNLRLRVPHHVRHCKQLGSFRRISLAANSLPRFA